VGVGATVRKVEFGDPKKTGTENRTGTEFLKFLGTETVEKNTLEPLKETELLNHEIDTKILKSM
jgi:hypothetical protein